jgi:hypothetical protein
MSERIDAANGGLGRRSTVTPAAIVANRANSAARSDEKAKRRASGRRRVPHG